MSVIINGGEINIEVKSSINIEVTGATGAQGIKGDKGETGEAGTSAPERHILVFRCVYDYAEFADFEVIINTTGETPSIIPSEMLTFTNNYLINKMYFCKVVNINGFTQLENTVHFGKEIQLIAENIGSYVFMFEFIDIGTPVRL